MDLIKYPTRLILTIIHLVFWIAYFFLIVEANSFRNTYDEAIILATSLIIPQIVLAYLNIGIYIPQLLIHKRYILYLSAVILSFAVIFILYQYRFEYIVKTVMDMPGPGRQGPPPPFEGRRPPNPFFMPLMGGINGLSGTFSIFLISTIYSLGKIAYSREREATTLKNENLNAELKYLKSQVNPHFLFNILNNIYASSILKSKKTPEMIKQLSDILRYNIYDGDKELVKLKKEIEYINNYISLRKLKDDKIENIELNFDEVDQELEIAPLLFIPFIENSFKHSKIEDDGIGWIKIDMQTRDNQLFFSVKNSKPMNREGAEDTGGFGLENVKRRLELLYPERHHLNIRESPNEYLVSLKIRL